jgi:hypothetical protein
VLRCLQTLSTAVLQGSVLQEPRVELLQVKDFIIGIGIGIGIGIIKLHQGSDSGNIGRERSALSSADISSSSIIIDYYH